MKIKITQASKILLGDKLGTTNGNGETVFVEVLVTESVEMNAKKITMVDGSVEWVLGTDMVAVEKIDERTPLRRRMALDDLIVAV